MQPNLGQYSKQISVAALMVLWLAMDLMHVNDSELRTAIMALIGVVTGWHGLTNLPFSVNGKSATQSLPVGTSVTISPPVTVLNTAGMVAPQNAQQ